MQKRLKHTDVNDARPNVDDEGRRSLDSHKCTSKRRRPCPLHGDDVHVDVTVWRDCTRVEKDGW